ncbi:MAG TPA: lysophospholipid acyltransferase family protein [Alphaproteobacteria bacterium]
MTLASVRSGIGLLLRSAAFNVLFFGYTAIELIVIVPALFLPPPRPALWIARTWARLMFALLRIIVGIRWEVRGPVDLLRGPVLIASKHQSAWDTIVFFLLCEQPTYAMKKELMLVPLYGWLARQQGHIAVDRTAGAAAIRGLLRASKAALAAGRQLVLFPEGTRVPANERHPYQPGIAGLYALLGVPVVPVALNSGLFWPRRSFMKYPGKVIVEVLPEIPPGLPRETFMHELETRIETATARLIAEARAADPGL